MEKHEPAYCRGVYKLIDRKDQQLHLKMSIRDLDMLKALAKHFRVTQAKVLRDYIQADYNKITQVPNDPEDREY